MQFDERDVTGRGSEDPFAAALKGLHPRIVDEEIMVMGGPRSWPPRGSAILRSPTDVVAENIFVHLEQQVERTGPKPDQQRFLFKQILDRLIPDSSDKIDRSLIPLVERILQRLPDESLQKIRLQEKFCADVLRSISKGDFTFASALMNSKLTVDHFGQEHQDKLFATVKTYWLTPTTKGSITLPRIAWEKSFVLEDGDPKRGYDKNFTCLADFLLDDPDIHEALQEGLRARVEDTTAMSLVSHPHKDGSLCKTLLDYAKASDTTEHLTDQKFTICLNNGIVNALTPSQRHPTLRLQLAAELVTIHRAVHPDPSRFGSDKFFREHGEKLLKNMREILESGLIGESGSSPSAMVPETCRTVLAIGEVVDFVVSYQRWGDQTRRIDTFFKPALRTAVPSLISQDLEKTRAAAHLVSLLSPEKREELLRELHIPVLEKRPASPANLSTGIDPPDGTIWPLPATDLIPTDDYRRDAAGACDHIAFQLREDPISPDLQPSFHQLATFLKQTAIAEKLLIVARGLSEETDSLYTEERNLDDKPVATFPQKGQKEDAPPYIGVYADLLSSPEFHALLGGRIFRWELNLIADSVGVPLLRG